MEHCLICTESYESLIDQEGFDYCPACCRALASVGKGIYRPEVSVALGDLAEAMTAAMDSAQS